VPAVGRRKGKYREGTGKVQGRYRGEEVPAVGTGGGGASMRRMPTS